MTTTAALGDFLRARRSEVAPKSVGLAGAGSYRRVPGLRREEVAQLAGVSTDYYTRLEQGRHTSPAAEVLDAIAGVLQLDATARRHLDDLVGAGRRRAAASPPRRRILLDPAARDLYLDWRTIASEMTAILRLDAGRYPDDPPTTDLVGELAVKSEDFNRWWGKQKVLERGGGSKRFRHPVVGDLNIDYEALTLPADPDQTLFVYTAQPGPSEQAMSLLASWSLDAPADRNTTDSDALEWAGDNTGGDDLATREAQPGSGPATG